MMRIFLVITWLSLFFCGCKEFIEPSLENQKMVLLAPGNKLESTNYQQTFWWERNEDAIAYHLQVVSPGFDSVSTLSLDTVVLTDKFTFTLDPSKYQWRVRAENGSSCTTYEVRYLTIYPSSLTNQQVQLVSPANAMFVGARVQFNWLKLFGSTQYRLQVDNNNFLDEQKLVLNEATTNTSFIQMLSKEGSYQYRVRAENATENSKWSSVRNFVYDITGPEKPILASPANGQSLAKPVKLLWNKIADADKYEIYIYKTDSSTLYNSSYPQVLTTAEHTFNAGTTGDSILWRIKAIDKAGNKGAFSELRTFVVQ